MLRRTLPLLCLLGMTELRAESRERVEVSAASVGMSETMLAEVDRLIEAAIRDGVTPGATLAVGRHGKLVRLRGYGHLDWSTNSAPASPSSIYDVASLTKVAGTTIGIMRHVEAGLIKLDDPVYRHLSYWPRKGRTSRITIRHLLAHTSGLPAGVDLARRGKTREQRIQSIARVRLVGEPGRRVVYSDLGMIVLGAILERKQGIRMDEYLRTRVYQPLGLEETLFCPSEDAPSLLDRIAPTEVSSRTGLAVHGVVHDPLAAALGGVAGHAGLFSSVRDLAVIAQSLMDGAKSTGTPLVQPATMKLFTKKAATGRALGWDLAGSSKSSGGQSLSAGTFGHTGFTGTSLWIDPEQDLFVVLLTNRLHPSARNNGHIALRRSVHDAIALAITDRTSARRTDATN